MFNSLSWYLVLSYLPEIQLILSGRNYYHRIKKNHDSVFYFLLGASALIYLWFIARYHWEIVLVCVKCQKHSSPSIKSHVNSAQAVCLRVTRSTMGLWRSVIVECVWCTFKGCIFHVCPGDWRQASPVKLCWSCDASADACHSPPHFRILLQHVHSWCPWGLRNQT